MPENQLETMMRRLWESACRDEPQRPSVRVIDGQFTLKITGNRSAWLDLIAAAGAPSHAEQRIDGDTLTVTWESIADTIFAEDGPIARHVGPNYELRTQQLHMARLVQRTIEMNDTSVIEAGTGVGKSYAYAAVCMAMGKKVVIATSNKALQMQLYKKDIPFLSQVFPGKKVALVQGKNNYACRWRAEDPMSGRVTMSNPDLIRWYATTESGNTEEIDFAIDWQDVGAITANDECLGKHCPFYDECFYYKAKAQRKQADVLICNHMLLALHQMYPGARILPRVDAIIIDEAHQLPQYVQNATGVELRLSSIEKRIERSGKDGDMAALDDVMATLRRFNNEITGLIPHDAEYQVSIGKSIELSAGNELANAIEDLADTVWPEDELPDSREGKAKQNHAKRLRSLAIQVRRIANTTEPGSVRWMDISGDTVLNSTPYDVSEFIARLRGITPVTREGTGPTHTHCARCHRELTAKTVAILDGQPYGPECIKHVDPMGDAETVSLEEWLSMDHAQVTPNFDRTPVIFTSATIAAPDFAHFMRSAGLPDALQMQLGSPFDYKENAMLYVPAGAAPTPQSSDYQPFLVNEIRRLVYASDGGAFCLFTSYANMRHVADALRPEFQREGLTVYVQGELPKLEIAKRFAATNRNVLFATKSFFEGVSIEGEALRLVIIDKMPFEAPNPINQAEEAALKDYARTVLSMPANRAEWYPFDALRLPRMILDLKQGSGRLIRTQRDWGVIAILDSRIRTEPYGRNKVIPALPPATMTHSAHIAGDFLVQRRFAPRENRQIANLETIEKFAVTAGEWEL